MLLINKVKINELNTYREEYLDCLKHNISNSIITKIIIWVDDPDHNIPKLSNKVDVFFKKDQSIFNAIEVSKKLTPEEVIIFSTTLFKFNHDLFKIRPEVVGQTVLTDGGNYFIFARNCQLSDVGQINGIFPLTRKKINLHTENQSVVKISHKSSGEAKAEIKPIIKAKSEQKVNFTAVRKKVLEKVGEFNSQKIIKRKGVIPQVEVKRRSKKLDVIIVSVNYNDLLIVSLSHNVKIFENITVVTSPDDLLCQKICQKFGVNCLVTSVMYEGGAVFNKGKAINEGIKSLDNPDFILLIDADIVLESKIDIDSLSEDVLYTSSRLICKSYQIYKSWKDENLDIEKVGRLENNKGIGFFQLFNISNSNVDRENPYPENSQNASWSDLIFRDKFPKKSDWGGKTIHLGDPYINWDGRVTRRFLTDEEFLEILQKRSTFTICSFYFNYNGDSRQKRNFVKFLQQWKDYYQNMIVGIVDYGDIDFEIPCEKVIIEGDVNKRIWSKEILINKIVEKIDTDYIIWIDGDIIYEDLSWLNNLDGVIGDNDFVQLFETINYLGENGEVLESHKSLVSGKGDVDKLLGAGYKPGGSWMTKTKLLKSNPLFEKMLVGGGDTILTYALWGVENGWTLQKVKEGSNEIYEEAKIWISNFGKRKVGYLPISVNHLYHGDLKDRNYNDRYCKLQETKEVSIIIPAYKAKNFIEECLDSILTQLKNINFEILIGIDGCMETLEFLKSNQKFLESCKIYFFEENVGPYYIRNTLADISEYKNLIFFDADDIMCDNLVTENLLILRDFESVRWKFMNFLGNIDENNFEQNKWHAHGVFSINKDKFLEMNGFVPWRIGADSEFLERSKKFEMKIFYTEDIMFYRRQHEENQTRNINTGIGSPARIEVQKKLKKMREGKDFINPEFIHKKKYLLINEPYIINKSKLR